MSLRDELRGGGGEIVVSGRPLCDDRPRARLFVCLKPLRYQELQNLHDERRDVHEGHFRRGTSRKCSSERQLCSRTTRSVNDRGGWAAAIVR